MWKSVEYTSWLEKKVEIDFWPIWCLLSWRHTYDLRSMLRSGYGFRYYIKKASNELHLSLYTILLIPYTKHQQVWHPDITIFIDGEILWLLCKWRSEKSQKREMRSRGPEAESLKRFSQFLLLKAPCKTVQIELWKGNISFYRSSETQFLSKRQN